MMSVALSVLKLFFSSRSLVSSTPIAFSLSDVMVAGVNVTGQISSAVFLISAAGGDVAVVGVQLTTAGMVC